MVEITRLTDLADPRLGDYVGLRDVQMRRSLEVEHGFFLAEGEKVVRRALESGHTPRSFLMAPRWVDSLADVLEQCDAPCYVLDEAAVEQVTGFHVHRGALAALERHPPADLDDVLAGARRVVVFDDIVDHANIGAGFRSAAALGVDAVLVTPSCADPLYRRAVKVSMGTVFQVPWTRLTAWPRDLYGLRDRGFTTAAFALADDSITLDELVLRGDSKLALIFGTEGHGLHPRVLNAAELTVRIPMVGGVDSLNVGSAAAVAFYATRDSG